MRAAAIAGIDRIESCDQTGIDGTLRDLVRRIPRTAIGHARHIESVRFVPLAVAQYPIQLPVVVWIGEGTIVVEQLKRIQQIAARERRRSGEQRASIS